jgi:hypothetical protein
LAPELFCHEVIASKQVRVAPPYILLSLSQEPMLFISKIGIVAKRAKYGRDRLKILLNYAKIAS